MKIAVRDVIRGLSIVLVLLVPSITRAAPPEPGPAPAQQGSATTPSNSSPSGNPDSGKTVESAPGQINGDLPNSPGSLHSQTPDEVKVEGGEQLLAQQIQSGAQQPVGTAAAEAPNTTGVMASKPAGAAIAPAKQRRVRMLLIKVGAVVGAGVAVGAVAALSSGSPSRPPGSH
jgi:hypothetical protein